MRTALRLSAGVICALSLAGAEGQQLIPTKGKEFWMGFMRNYDSVLHLDLYISSEVNASGTVSSPLLGWSQPFNVVANSVTTVDVPVTNMHYDSEIIDNKSVHILSDDTISVYALSFQSATADAAVIYPIKSIGTEYRVMAYRGFPGIDAYASEFLIVATEDATEVEITPTANTVGGHQAGVAFTVQLNQGESYQVQADTSDGDLTGTLLRSTEQSGACRPYAVFSGSVCPQVPAGCVACDHLYEQDLPAPFWGTSYYSVPWENTTAYAYRILAHVDNTNVVVDGGAPITLNAGQFVEVNNTAGPHCFTGDHPFCVGQFMQGSACAGNSDPAFLLLNAQEQKINDVTFATVVSNAMTAQYINVVVDGNDVGNVVLDGNDVPAIQFTTFPFCSDRAYASLPLNQGSHSISCPNGLTGYVYGTGPNYETYAYSVGGFMPGAFDLELDTSFCLSDTTDFVTLVAPQPLFNPVWTTQSAPGDTIFEGLSYTFLPTTSEVYILSGATNAGDCISQFFFSVEIDDPPTPSIAPVPPVCAYTPVHIDLSLSPIGTYVYSWTPTLGMTDPHVQDPTLIAVHSGWYHVDISSLNGCSATEDSVYITVTDGDVLNVNAISDPTLLCEGSSAQLSVNVDQIIASDDFNNGTGPLWEDIQGGISNSVCGSVEGNALWFNSAGSRYAKTVPLDVSNGGSVRFALKIASGVAPCEDVDAGENILVEYSLNGSSWTIMATYYESQFPEFGSVILPIPPLAQTPNTRFRWRQLLNSGVGQDNWVLDDVAIGTDDNTNIVFNWTPTATLDNATVENPLATPPVTETYTVDLLDEETGCTYTDEVTVTVGPLFDLDVTNDTAVCGVGLGVQLNAVPVQSGTYTWQWSPDDGTLTSLYVADPFAYPTTTTDYIVQVTSLFGCVVTDTVTVTMGQVPTTDVFVVPDVICQGQSAQLQVQVYQGSGSYIYLWSPPDDLDNSAIATPIASPQVTTVYTVVVQDALCGYQVNDQVTLTVLPAPPVDLGADQDICPDETIVLDAGTADSWLWSTSAITQQISVDDAGTYWVAATNGVCTALDTILIALTPDPGELGSTVFNCTGGSATLSIPYANGTYLWGTGETTQSITASELGDHPFTLIDAYGCTYNDVVTLVVDPLLGGIVVPNVISPNGDGYNELFEPLSGGNKEVAVIIYNRFGQEVFNAPNMNTLWHGDNGGSPVPEGTYFYIIRYTPACEAKEREEHGTVTVVR